MFQLQAPPAFAYRSAGDSAAVGGSAAAAWQRRRFGVSSAFAYRSAYPGTYPRLSQVTDIISMVYGSTGVPAPGLSNARNASASGPVATVIFSYFKCFCIFCSFLLT